jgi:hypothetical protein
LSLPFATTGLHKYLQSSPQLASLLLLFIHSSIRPLPPPSSTLLPIQQLLHYPASVTFALLLQSIRSGIATLVPVTSIAPPIVSHLCKDLDYSRTRRNTHQLTTNLPRILSVETHWDSYSTGIGVNLDLPSPLTQSTHTNKKTPRVFYPTGHDRHIDLSSRSYTHTHTQWLQSAYRRRSRATMACSLLAQLAAACPSRHRHAPAPPALP